MQKPMCFIVLILVLSMSAPLASAQTSPIIIGGGGRTAAQVQSSQKPRDDSKSLATMLIVPVITMLINARVI